MPHRIIKTPREVPRSAGEPTVNHHQAHAALQALANPSKAEFLANFFKTGKGQYAEGDRFLGIMVPASDNLPGNIVGSGWRIVSDFCNLPTMKRGSCHC